MGSWLAAFVLIAACGEGEGDGGPPPVDAPERRASPQRRRAAPLILSPHLARGDVRPSNPRPCPARVSTWAPSLQPGSAPFFWKHASVGGLDSGTLTRIVAASFFAASSSFSSSQKIVFRWLVSKGFFFRLSQ